MLFIVYKHPGIQCSQGRGFSHPYDVSDSIQTRIDTHIHLYDTRRAGSSAFLDPVVNAFGCDRVIFGSNWPLSDMLGSYNDMVKMLDD